MKYFITILALGLCFGLNAQSIEPQVVGSTGAHYTSTGAQLSFTAGEVMIETVTATNSMITQGFHQPESSGVGIADNGAGKIKVNVFPNPTFDQLNIRLEDHSQNFEVMIFDVQGKQVHKSTYKENDSQKQINVQEWAAGSYVLKLISKDNKHTASYKLQKMK